MKDVVTDNNSNHLCKTAILHTPSKISLNIVMAAGLLLGTALNSQAASQGRLGAESSGSIGITLTIPDRLNVKSSNEAAVNQLSTSSSESSGLDNILCVQGTGIDHYSLSVSGSSGSLVLSSDVNKDIPYQISWNDDGEKIIIPSDNKDNRLVIKTDASCDDPSSVKIDISDDEALDEGDYSGAAILNIGVE